MRPPELLAFCSSIEELPLSIFIQSTSWVVPVVQIIHIFAIAMILISSITINLYVLQSNYFQLNSINILKQFRKLMYFSLFFLFLSGLILIIGEPARSLANIAFQIKMLFLLTALIISLYMFSRIEKSQYISKIYCLLAITMWLGIVFSGRWIAYV
jgi:hypothetical protein